MSRRSYTPLFQNSLVVGHRSERSSLPIVRNNDKYNHLANVIDYECSNRKRVERDLRKGIGRLENSLDIEKTDRQVKIKDLRGEMGVLKREFFERVAALTKETRVLKDEIKELRLALLYRPNGSMYQQVKAHFDILDESNERGKEASEEEADNQESEEEDIEEYISDAMSLVDTGEWSSEQEDEGDHRTQSKK